MKTTGFFFIASVAFLLSIALNAQPDSNIYADRLLQDFRISTENWRQAYNSGNAQNLLPMYAEDADYVSAHVDGLEANGRDRLIANFQNGMNSGGHIDSIEILKWSISCDMATLLCKYQATNSGVTVVGRNLLVMRRIDGSWLITLHMTVV